MAIHHFSQVQQDAIKKAIEKAELQTSGEIRVFVEEKCPTSNVLDRAAYQFELLKMHKTEARNGVLIYVAINDHRFAIIGDVGINQKVPADFWDSTKDAMVLHFKNGDVTAAICEGIKRAGTELVHYFPYSGNDTNELPNEIAH
jgi:uncharacterized membrane protein